MDKTLTVEADTSTLDFDAMHAALQAVAGMENAVASDGTETSRYTLTHNEAEVFISIPDGVDENAVEAAVSPTKVAAWVAPAPLASSSQADETRAGIVSDNLQAAGVTPGELPAKYQDLLARAKAGIPWFEGFVGGKEPTDAELASALAAFQALPQATKDRALFNCLRTLAAIMRYNTGDI